MNIIKPIKQIEVSGFNNFLLEFNIKSNKKAGIDGYDEELIINEINKFPNQKWIVDFISDNNDGYFRLLQLK